MSSKEFIVITGASQGLGYHAASALVRASTGVVVPRVVLACRNVSTARAAAAKIAAAGDAGGASRIIVLDTPLDLSNLASVRSYASALRAFLAAEGAAHGIIALINNAGVGGSPYYTLTADGHDTIWATNHLGHFLLTLLLLPATVAAVTAPPAGAPSGPALRIVNVSSEVHDPEAKTGLPDPGLHWPDSRALFDSRLAAGAPLEGESAMASGGRRYARSKLCNVLFTNELARRLSGAVPHGAAAPEDASSTVSAPAGAAASSLCTLPNAAAAGALAFNPGLMLDTGFVAGVAGGVLGSLVGGVAWALAPVLRLGPLGRLMRTGAASGADLAALATRPAAALPAATAAYYDGATLKPSSAFSLSPAVTAAGSGAQAQLWEHSLRWAAVSPAELREAGFEAEAAQLAAAV